MRRGRTGSGGAGAGSPSPVSHSKQLKEFDEPEINDDY
jgi:hypothetical protein